MGRHIHFDCKDGVTVESLLAACFDAAPAVSQLPSIVNDRMESIFPASWRSIGTTTLETKKNPALAVQTTWDIGPETGQWTAATCSGLRETIRHPPFRSLLLERYDQFWTVLDNAKRTVARNRDSSYSMTTTTLMMSVCVLVVLDILDVQTTSCSAVRIDEGIVIDEDGSSVPVPSPLLLNILVGIQVYLPGTEIIVNAPSKSTSTPGRPFETFPPGNELSVSNVAAALLRCFVDQGGSCGKPPVRFVPEKVGTGTDRWGRVENSVWLGSSVTSTEGTQHDAKENAAFRSLSTPSIHDSHNPPDLWERKKLTVLEANLDDITAEALALAVEVLLNHGALDAWVTPIVMKKGRAAHMLHCLCRSDDDVVNKLLQTMFRTTTTLGIRIRRDIDRVALRRKFVTVKTPFVKTTRKGLVDVKIGMLGDEVVSMKAEFDHCKSIALDAGVTFQTVAEKAVAAAREQLDE